MIESLDLTKLINDMTHLLQLSVSKSVALRFDLADDLPAVRADASQMRQVVLNLVINASEAIGDDSGMLAVRTGEITADERYLADFFTDHRPAGDYVYLEVSDDGVGMDKASVAKIFDPFFTTKFTGRGLGLAAVMGIVRGHDEGILRARKRQYVQDAASVQRQSAHGRGFVDDGNRDQARSGWNYPGCRR